MKTNFLLTQDDFSTEEFAANITEMVLDLENSFESPEELSANVQEMFIYTANLATEMQSLKFQKIARFFQQLRDYLRANEETYFDAKYMLRSFADGRFLVNEETFEVLYFDHPMHQHLFNQQNIKKEWSTTETK